MTKPLSKDVKRELEQRTTSLVSEVERLKRNAENLLHSMKQQEISFVRKEEEKKLRAKQKEQQELVQNQAKAWTMPDDDIAEAKVETAAPEAKMESSVAISEDKPALQEAENKSDIRQEEQKSEKSEKSQETPAKTERKEMQHPAAEKQTAMRDKAAARPYAERRQPSSTAPSARPAMRPQGAQGFEQRPTGMQRSAERFAQNRPQQGNRFAPNAKPFDKPPYPPRAQGQGGRPPMKDGDKAFPAGQRAAGRPGVPGAQRARAPKPEALDVFPALEKERVSNYDPNKKSYERNVDPERVSKSKRQASRTTTKHTFNGYDDDVVRGGKKARAKKPSIQQMMSPIKIDKAYMTAQSITVKDLSERTGKPVGELLKAILLLGVGGIPTINSELDFDTAFLVCSNFGIELEMKMEKTAEEVLQDTYVEDSDEELVSRPPVITIMGHVDHGKTSLLDYIRRAHVTSTEAGGITQHIGAYSVNVNGNSITFLDTPGHEAFTAMRARGAKSTDIAVLVVAADDGVMPQTVEAINHARAAEVPIIVAINKMDKDTANPERIKQDLTAYNIVPEEWGGDAILVPVSAKTGAGVDNLLEMILLQAEVLQLKANPNRLAKGVIIEAKLDKNRGALATVLLQNGTLKVGDNIIAGHASGRIRAMLNDRGERVNSAGPSMPVEISGFDDVPDAGDELFAVEDEKLIKQVAQDRKDKLRTERIQASCKVSLDNLFENINEGKIETLNIIIKADVQGSSEAVRQALEKLSNDKVKIKVLHSGVGAITKDDVNLAIAFNAIIIGFNIRPDSNAKEISEKENVDIRLYRVIYQAIEDMEKAMLGMLEPVFKEVVLGHAEVRNVFKITGAGTIAGCYVTDGKMQRNASVRLLRDNVVIFEGKLSSLKRFKDDAKEVTTGFECGIGLANYNDIKNNDIIECYVEEEVQN